MGIQMSKYTIHVLTEGDRDWFINTAAISMLTDEVKHPELVNIPHLNVLTDKVIEDETAFIAKSDGVCVGALAAILTPNLYNPELKTFVELFWYVLPAHRNSRAGLLLLSAFDKKGESCSDFSAMSLLGDSKVNIKTMNKKGYSLTEYAFLKENRKS